MLSTASGAANGQKADAACQWAIMQLQVPFQCHESRRVRAWAAQLKFNLKVKLNLNDSMIITDES